MAVSQPNPTTSFPNLKQTWHNQPLDKTIDLLETDGETGLSDKEVKRRLTYYGKNEITEIKGRNNWQILLDQFKNIMLLMLILVAIISAIMEFSDLQAGIIEEGTIPFKDPIAIFAIVILNGILGFFQESRAEKALAALKKMSSPRIRVIRENKTIEVDGVNLVPGDIILIEAGSQLCADGQVISANGLQIRESALTGEANSVNKKVSPQGLPENISLGDRTNMVFTGTEVIQGRGKVVVTATGMETELGKIAQMIQDVKSEPTPLQQRMTHLGNILVISSLILVILVVLFGSLQVGNWSRIKELVEVSLSMAVAVVPEGLPAVITVTLAIGTQRMVRKKALIRKLPAVETLGSVNTICSDKTGTLTQNKMVVQEIRTLNHNFQVTGEGYSPEGEFLNQDQQKIEPGDYEELNLLLMNGVLCNDGILAKEKDWTILGDPTEGALLSLGGKGGFFQKNYQNQFKRVGEFPFSSERKCMTVICQGIGPEKEEGLLIFTKGSPEVILDRCDQILQGDQASGLTPQQRSQIIEQNNKMAGDGLRVLGFAYKPIDSIPLDETTAEKNLIWLGLAGMLDAPRPEVKKAVERCREAGIRPIMITGDHQLTARAIALKLGIARAEDHVLTGIELEQMSQEDLEKEVSNVSIYARVSPEHKLRIVKALQKQGRFVAMTGDGVNDAPALKQADIGIAMGITGTDVSKEASDMVLLDDNFATIVAATEEGRVVYTNIRRFIKYILGSNVGEVLTIAAAPLLGLPEVPLIPLQILWMNLVTDGIPALALALEPAEPNVMSFPPFSPKENIFARGLGSYIIRIGIIFAIFTIILMVWAFHAAQNTAHPESWKTMVFTSLCIAQMGHAIACRSDYRLTAEINPLSNPYLLGAVIVTTILQLLLIYVPFLRQFFDTEILTIQQLLICLGVSSLMFVWVELEKLFIRWYHQQ
jgi:P-type Ca2+ transporter type 2C